MHTYCCRILLTIFVVVIMLTAIAQQTPLINGDFSGISFKQFVQRIESNTGYYFYYNPVDVDSFTINEQDQNMPLPDLLDNTFLHTDFHYSIIRCSMYLLPNFLPFKPVFHPTFLYERK